MSLLRWLVSILVLIGSITTYYFIDWAEPTRVPHTKAIIIGATSGIGKALAHELSKRGYTVGITGRRKQLLQDLKTDISTPYDQVMDVTNPEKAQQQLEQLIADMGGMDLIIINAGVGNLSLDWPEQKKIIDTNVTGFTAIAAAATQYFIQQGSGHIVGISSIAALRGMPDAPTYCASKAYVSHYLDGLRARFVKMNLPIRVTNIEPGLIDTAMGIADFAWRETPQEAAVQIVDALERRYDHAYITKRWRLIAWAFQLLPDWLFYKLV